MEVNGIEVGKYRVLRAESSSVPNAIGTPATSVTARSAVRIRIIMSVRPAARAQRPGGASHPRGLDAREPHCHVRLPGAQPDLADDEVAAWAQDAALSLRRQAVSAAVVVTPLLVGKRMDLSPVVVFISVVSFGWIWGVVGALLAVPIVASIKICLINLPRTRVFGTLLGR